jgi:hypothetical protein
MKTIKDLFLHTEANTIVKELTNYYGVEKLPQYIEEYIEIRDGLLLNTYKDQLDRADNFTLEFGKLPGCNNYLIQLFEQSEKGKEFRKITRWNILTAEVSESTLVKFNYGEILSMCIPKIISLKKSYMMNNVEVIDTKQLDNMFVDAMQTNLLHKEEIFHKIKMDNDSKLNEFKQKGLI